MSGVFSDNPRSTATAGFSERLRVRRAASLSVPGAGLNIPWDAAPDFATRITAPAIGGTEATIVAAGDYLIGAHLDWDTPPSGNFRLYIDISVEREGGVAHVITAQHGGVPFHMALVAMSSLPAAATVRLFAWPATAAAVTLLGAEMWIRRIG